VAVVRLDFERLEVFKLSVDAVAAVDALAEALPEGRGYIRDQLRRAANSIPLNIAEGAGEYALAEKARFYRIAKRSATECAGQILVCARLGITEAPRVEAAMLILQRVISMLVKIVQRCSGGARRASAGGAGVSSCPARRARARARARARDQGGSSSQLENGPDER
jgi:four helix bundle protein